MALTNEIRLVGHAAAEPQQFNTVVRVNLYTKHWWHNNKGELKEQEECHRCLFFGTNAEKARRFIQKGTQVLIKGTVHYSVKEKEGGIKAYFTDVLVEEFMVTDKIAVSKEMYKNLFPQDEPNRVVMGSTHEQNNFDQEVARIHNQELRSPQ